MLTPNNLYANCTIGVVLALTLVACNSTQRNPATDIERELTQTSPAAASGDQGSNTRNVTDCTADNADLLGELLVQLNETRSSARNCGSEQFQATDALSTQSQLGEAAVAHSQDMAQHNFFSHTGSDGRSADSRIDATGYSWSAIGENIAGGQTKVSSVIRDWLSSPGHCANIMRSDYTDVGLSCVQNDQTDLKLYWTAVFAKPLR